MANNDENRAHLKLYSLNKVLSKAEEWKRIHKNDEDAHFYFAVLQLINAFQTNDKKEFLNAKKSFNKCAEIYKKKFDKIGMPPRWLKKEFLLGKDSGLRRLVIFDSKIDISKLEAFRGEIEDNSFNANV